MSKICVASLFKVSHRLLSEVPIPQLRMKDLFIRNTCVSRAILLSLPTICKVRVIMSSLQIWELKIREMKSFPQGHSAACGRIGNHTSICLQIPAALS